MEYQNDEQIYMEQEEEWEREGLLDPAWEKQQKKVGLTIFVCIYFSAWTILLVHFIWCSV